MFFKSKADIFCNAPFEQIMVFENGDILFCCEPLWHKDSVLGNIHTQSFEEIWNSQNAQEIRRLAVKNKYPYCKNELCHLRISGDLIAKSFLSNKKVSYTPKMKTFPRFVYLSPDYECNLRCITCRKDIFRYSDEEIEKRNSKIETIYLPILKDAEIVMLNSSGEALASRHSRALIKAIVKTYPNIKFSLLTNGLLCNKTNLQQLNIEDKLSSVIVSINASTKETYEKFSPDSNFDTIMNNMSYLKELRFGKKLNAIIVSFVITSINYKEIPSFIKYADYNNFYVQFIHYVKWGNELRCLPEELSVFKSYHPEYKEYLKICRDYIIPYQKKSQTWLKRNI